MAAGYENLAGFRPWPGPDMIFGALFSNFVKLEKLDKTYGTKMRKLCSIHANSARKLIFVSRHHTVEVAVLIHLMLILNAAIVVCFCFEVL